MRTNTTSLLLIIGLLAASTCGLLLSAQEEADDFRVNVQPFIDNYCLSCHKQPSPAANLDLSIFKDRSAFIAHFEIWEKAIRLIRDEEMPPPEQAQPSVAERTALLQWHERFIDTLPPPNLPALRRMTHLEFENSVRTLTELDLALTREFPRDVAAGQGFSNTALALQQSPELFKHYLSAAEKVVQHLVPTPSGFYFAPAMADASGHLSSYYGAQLKRFYQRFTALSSRKHLEGLWQYQQIKQPELTLSDFAKAQRLNSVYLERLYNFLNRPADHSILQTLQAIWQESLKQDQARAWERMQQAVTALRGEWLRGKPPERLDGLSYYPFRYHPYVDYVLGTRARNRGFDPQWLSDRIKVKLPISVMSATEPLTIKLLAVESGKKPVSARLLNPVFKKADGKSVHLTLSQYLASYEPDLSYHSTTSPDNVTSIIIPENGLVLALPASARAELKGCTFEATIIALPDDGECSAFQVHTGNAADRFEPGRPILSSGLQRERLSEVCSSLCTLFAESFMSERLEPDSDAPWMFEYFRDDDPLYRAVLSESERVEIDRLWDEWHFTRRSPERDLRYTIYAMHASGSAIKDFHGSTDFLLHRIESHEFLSTAHLDHLERKLREYASRRGKLGTITLDYFQRLRREMVAFREREQKLEPLQFEVLLNFAARAWRRPIAEAERIFLEERYKDFRHSQQRSQAESLQACIKVILLSPHFLYLPVKVVDERLAGYQAAQRISYTLWAAPPDHELLQWAAVVERRRLFKAETFSDQLQRMLTAPEISGLAEGFFAEWLGFNDFMLFRGVNQARYPQFDLELQTAMYREPIAFLTDLLQRNGSLLELLEARHTFMNEVLAKHYQVTLRERDDPTRFRKVDAPQLRGGLLGMSVFLTKHSPGLRTSIVRRGTWIVETLLGQELPPPPPDVPDLPQDERSFGERSGRELVALHTSNVTCAGCHNRIDPYGIVLESFDPLGRFRETEPNGMRIDTSTILPDKTRIDDLEALKRYLSERQRENFGRHFLRKLAGYALNRTLHPKDRPLLQALERRLVEDEYRLHGVLKLLMTHPAVLFGSME